ncbi:MAG: hypothetical protein AAB407_00715 [Patescibacteria group bacterium]
MSVQFWVDTLARSLQELWIRVGGFLPELIGALIVLIIGLIVAAGLEKLVERLVYYLKIDSLLRQFGVEAFMARANMRLNAGHFFGQLVYWFFILVFVLAASDILGFGSLSSFLTDVLNYIPKVLVAALILLATIIVANFLRGLIRASMLGAKMHSAKALGTIAWWGVVVFGFLTALVELGVAVQIINTLITGLVAMLALAGGLAFGLGGKDHAHQWLSRVKEEFNHRG